MYFIHFIICNHVQYARVLIRHAITIITYVITSSLSVTIHQYNHFQFRFVLCVSSINESWLTLNDSFLNPDKFLTVLFHVTVFTKIIFSRETIPYTGNEAWLNEWVKSSKRNTQKCRNEQFLENSLYHFIASIICSRWILISSQ